MTHRSWDAVITAAGASNITQSLLINWAKEKGHCEYFGRTKYSMDLPIDTYKKEVDEITSEELKYDWESLRSSVLEFGLVELNLSHNAIRDSSLCQTPQTELNHPVTSCPLRSPRKGS